MCKSLLSSVDSGKNRWLLTTFLSLGKLWLSSRECWTLLSILSSVHESETCHFFLKSCSGIIIRTLSSIVLGALELDAFVGLTNYCKIIGFFFKVVLYTMSVCSTSDDIMTCFLNFFFFVKIYHRKTHKILTLLITSQTDVDYFQPQLN